MKCKECQQCKKPNIIKKLISNPKNNKTSKRKKCMGVEK